MAPAGNPVALITGSIDGRGAVLPDDRLEREVRVEIRKTLETLGWSVYDMEQERETRQTPGPTDLIAFRGPVVAFLEIKRPQRRGEAHQGLSKDQRVFRDRVAQTPAIHRVLFDEGDAIQFHQECAR